MEESRRCLSLLAWLVNWLNSVVKAGLQTVGVIQLIGLVRLVLTYTTTRSLTYLINGWQRLSWSALEGALPAILPCNKPAVANVFFVPGYTDYPVKAIGLARRLRQCGAVVVFAAVGENGNDHTRAEALKNNRERLADLARIARGNGAPVVFIGHSLGGVHAGWLAKAFTDASGLPVKLIISIQAPLRGSPLARFGVNGGAKELLIDKAGRPCPAVLETIEVFRGLEVSGVLLKFFCAIYDEVNPRRFCRLPRNGLTPGCWAETLPQIGHWGALQNPWAVDVIVGYINHVLRSAEAAETEH